MRQKKIRSLWHNDLGGTFTMFALMLPVLVGFSGVGIDMSEWYMERRAAQSLADMAAVQGGHQVKVLSGDALDSSVDQFLDGKGYDGGHDTVVVNSPPSVGAYAGQATYVEVIYSRQVPLRFLSAFNSLLGGDLAVTVSARAVAGSVITGSQCIVALDPDADRAINISGTADVESGCGIASNSTSDESIYVGGNATLNADPAVAVGDISVSGGGEIISSQPLQSFSNPAPNPYETLQVPPDSPCLVEGNTTVGDDESLPPGRYCGDILVQGTNSSLQPGTYIVDGGDFEARSGAILTGDGVTIILTGETSEEIGTVDINGGATVTLSAPTSGDYQGILLFQDPNAEYREPSNTANLNGGANLSLSGVVYFPRTDIVFNGGVESSSTCLQVYGATIDFLGDNVISADDDACEAMGISNPSVQSRVQLVE